MSAAFLAVVTVVVGGVYHLHAIPREFSSRLECERAVSEMRLPKPKSSSTVIVACNEIIPFWINELGQSNGDVPWLLPKR